MIDIIADFIYNTYCGGLTLIIVGSKALYDVIVNPSKNSWSSPLQPNMGGYVGGGGFVIIGIITITRLLFPDKYVIAYYEDKLENNAQEVKMYYHTKEKGEAQFENYNGNTATIIYLYKGHFKFAEQDTIQLKGGNYSVKLLLNEKRNDTLFFEKIGR